MKSIKQSLVTYLPLSIFLFNALFLLQLVFSYFPGYALAEQWIITIANFILLVLGVLSVDRKRPKHFARTELTLFQILFFLIMVVHGVILLVLIASKPLIFLIYMPFEFFIIMFYVGFYFLLTRHIFPIKR